MIVFETKHLLGASYDGTDAIPLSQTATFNIKCLKWYLKDSPIRLDLECFQQQQKTLKNRKITFWVSIGRLSIFFLLMQ